MKDIKELTINELLDGSDKYVIPIYQRNYAWEEKEIEQLLQDIIDYIPNATNDAEKNYYIGTLIINQRTENNTIVFETIDGQQRLTTLSILTGILKKKMQGKAKPLDWYNEVNLTFDSRSQSTETLEAVFNHYFPNHNTYNDGIINGYNLIKKHLDRKLSESKISLETFTDFLFKNVKILRVQVPEGTDLNHYFEIMNTRGEQLEKHEVLKASLLSVYNEIKDEEKKTKRFAIFNLIWEAVSEMDYYLQYKFNINTRTSIFGADWNRLQVESYDALLKTLKNDNFEQESGKLSIDEILLPENDIKPKTQNNEDNSDRFHAVINFSNFLLHTLRVILKDSKVVLDDKRLLFTFEDALRKEKNKIEFVDNFIYHLLKIRFLFDKYVIKRELLRGVEQWSLKTLKHYKDAKASYVNTFETDEDWDNQTVVMLLSMFHVSTPTLIYKHWLNSALYYLNENYDLKNEIDCNKYITYLEKFAANLLINRFLSKDEPIEYFDLIYTPEKLGLTKRVIAYNEPKLMYGAIENNLVFNFLDYILWQEEYDNDFEFTFRSSVEHYYPQHPIGGDPIKNKNVLHSFGNLCLISHSKNSKLNNHLPSAKKDYYAKIETNGKADSIKQSIMFKYDVNTWGKESILDHNTKMIDLYNSYINKIL